MMSDGTIGRFVRYVARALPPSVSVRLPRRPVRLDRRRSALPKRTLRSVQKATFAYRYAGLACLKNPFDLALYMMLMSRERPRTIVEIGSHRGGSAVWFAAQSRGLDLGAHVWSLDIDPVIDVHDPDVTFLEGDIHDLASSRLPSVLADCPRPLLVVEDGPHTFEACLAAMEFLHPHMQRGDFLVVEDGIVKDLRHWEFDDGPNRAIAAFLAAHPGAYGSADEYCHFYGHNVTWNTNGYLKRL